MQTAPEIIYKDADLIAINKPSGWLSIPDRHDAELYSVKSWFEAKGEKIFIVHRIDRDTSGLLLLARNAEAHKYYNTLFEQRTLKKTYYGLVLGSVAEDNGVYERFRGYTWVKFQIETGRTHQIRVHLYNAGHSLVCDPLYGKPDPILLSSIKRKFNMSKKEEEERPLLSRLALHAYSVDLVDRQGVSHAFVAPLPRDLDATLKQLRKWG